MSSVSKSSGWGWPRLVDISKPTTPVRERAASVKSHTGAIQSSEHDSMISTVRKRASSLKSHISTAPENEEEEHCPDPAHPVSHRTDVVSQTVHETPETVPLPLSPDRKKNLVISPFLENDTINQSPEQTSTAVTITHQPPLPPEAEEALQIIPEIPDKRNTVSTPSVESVFERVTGYHGPEEHPKGAVILSSTNSSVITLDSSQITPPHKLALEFFHTASETVTNLPPLVSTSTTSLPFNAPQEHNGEPRPFPVFRELPAALPVVPTSAPSIIDITEAKRAVDVPTLSDFTKLAPPKILVIRATEDSTEDHVRAIPVAPTLFDDINVGPDDIPRPTSLQIPSEVSFRSLRQTSQPSTEQMTRAARSTTSTVRTSPGIVQVPLHRGIKKRRIFIRKTRRVVLRSPILGMILGRELASLTRPLLKTIAEGGHLSGITELNGTILETVSVDPENDFGALEQQRPEIVGEIAVPIST
ncbi:hypothetical protein MMC19_003272 [Ptychographa xylographoides]|nr:hypothetical protein [Ptychographa xylographoides]